MNFKVGKEVPRVDPIEIGQYWSWRNESGRILIFKVNDITDDYYIGQWLTGEKGKILTARGNIRSITKDVIDWMGDRYVRLVEGDLFPMYVPSGLTREPYPKIWYHLLNGILEEHTEEYVHELQRRQNKERTTGIPF